MGANLILIRVVFTLMLVLAGFLIKPIPAFLGLPSAAVSAVTALIIALASSFLNCASAKLH